MNDVDATIGKVVMAYPQQHTIDDIYTLAMVGQMFEDPARLKAVLKEIAGIAEKIK